MAGPRIRAALEHITRRSWGRDYAGLAALLAHWTDVVGDPWAGQILPVRLRPPRPDRPADGAILELQVPAGAALLLQHELPLLLARLNAFLGGRPIGRIVLHQVMTMPPVAAPKLIHSPSPAAQATLAEETAEIRDDQVAAALRAFGQAMFCDLLAATESRRL